MRVGDQETEWGKNTGDELLPRPIASTRIGARKPEHPSSFPASVSVLTHAQQTPTADATMHSATRPTVDGLIAAGNDAPRGGPAAQPEHSMWHSLRAYNGWHLYHGRQLPGASVVSSLRGCHVGITGEKGTGNGSEQGSHGPLQHSLIHCRRSGGAVKRHPKHASFAVKLSLPRGLA
ncbi:hypothetical protein ACCO45_009581 [Purpureocillium lilacinum]|uniref:Uncharacterized protein n=1 Tax=Purpureocillium lilacinum TaxID=33203 RepID=A0ACC4DN25_PURLI